MSTDQLPRRQQQLYDLLKGRGDVPVLEIYKTLYADDAEARSVRYAQQYIGSAITRANRRLARRGLKIQPGQLKGCYKLAVMD